MKLEMICTGEEVLSGQIVDTNAAWFSNLMMEQGVEIQRRTTVGDRLEDLVEVFQERSQQADIILVNGGLGPTSDDLSAEAMAAAKGEHLVESKEWVGRLEDWWLNRAKLGKTMPASNLKQALLPASAIMIDNPVGTACGFRVRLNQAWLFFTPGVPFEFKKMVQEQFLPFLKQESSHQEPVFLKKLLTFGHGESKLADELDSLALPEGIALGYRSSMPHIEIKVFARGEPARQHLPAVVNQIKAKLGTAIVSEQFPTLGEEIHHRLVQEKALLSVAESCTGGMLVDQLVAFPGSSRYLHQGVVTYSNAAKQQLLGVKPETLAQQGAVSLETVSEMAEGVRALLDSDYALATSGIAGPDGGTEEKPVGTVTIALATRTKTWSQQILLARRSRTLVRQLSCAVAYDMLRRVLDDEDPIVDYSTISRVRMLVS